MVLCQMILVKAYVYLYSKTDLVTTLHWTIIDTLHSVLCCRKCLNIVSCINFFRSSELQFEFKKGIGCSGAIFVLNQTVDYFTSRGSTVYMAALDAQKAFDRVNHVKLFNILMNRNLPSQFIKTIVNWYMKISSVFK